MLTHHEYAAKEFSARAEAAEVVNGEVLLPV
jgi:hypothetical protein